MKKKKIYIALKYILTPTYKTTDAIIIIFLILGIICR